MPIVRAGRACDVALHLPRPEPKEKELTDEIINRSGHKDTRPGIVADDPWIPRLDTAIDPRMMLPNDPENDPFLPRLAANQFRVKYQGVAMIDIPHQRKGYFVLYRIFDGALNESGGTDSIEDLYVGYEIRDDPAVLSDRGITPMPVDWDEVITFKAWPDRQGNQGTEQIREVAIPLGVAAPNQPEEQVRKYFHVLGTRDFPPRP